MERGQSHQPSESSHQMGSIADLKASQSHQQDQSQNLISHSGDHENEGERLIKKERPVYVAPASEMPLARPPGLTGDRIPR